MRGLQREDQEDEELSRGPNFIKAYQITGEAKLPGTIEFIMHLYDSGLKFIVFAHHLSVLDGIESAIKKMKGLQYIRIDGST